MSTVSIYPNIKEWKADKRISIHDILTLVREGRWKDKIEALRSKVLEETDDVKKHEKEIGKLKGKLPYFTASGAFSERTIEGLIQHSGKLAIDFDKLSDIPATREKLIGDKYTEYVFASCTGRGLCVIVNIDSSKHLDSFLFLEKYYKEVYGLTIDKACKDVSRARYISFDEDLFYNPYAEPVDITFNISTYDPTGSMTIDNDDEKYDWVKKLVDKQSSFISGQRHEYAINLSSFLNKCGVDQTYAFNRMMSDFCSSDFDEKEIRDIIKWSYNKSTVFGTFQISKKIQDLPPENAQAIKKAFARVHALNEQGHQWTKTDVENLCTETYLTIPVIEGIFKNVYKNHADAFGIETKPDIAKIELFIRKNYDIQRNEVTGRIDFRQKGEENFSVLNVHTIYRDVQHTGFKFSLDKLKSLMASDFVPVYNPITDYFEGLSEWTEEEEDYIKVLASHVKTDNDAFWHVQFKKALVRCIAQSLGKEVNRIIVTLVEAAQETGKTSFIRFLCPPALAAYYTETQMDASKDSDLQLAENFIWNMEELAALANNEINKLKATISKATVKQRRSYAEFHETNPRRVNFWASTNKTEFLVDDQNTRWLCFNVLAIDHNYSNYKTGVKNVDIDNVWRQAWALYKSGFDYRLSKDEAVKRDEGNKVYEMSSLEKDLILKHFKHVEPPRTGEMISSTEIVLRLQSATDNKVKLNIYAVGRAMKQLGFTQHIVVNGKNKQRCWHVQGISSLPGSPQPILEGINFRDDNGDKLF